MKSVTAAGSLATWAVLGVACLGLACERKSPVREEAPAPVLQARASEAPTPGESGDPSVVLHGPGDYVTEGAENIGMTVETTTPTQVRWFVVGGEITAGASDSAMTFKVLPGSQRVQATCRVQDAAGRERVRSLTMAVVAPPDIATFEARTPAVTMGQPARLAWTAKEIKSLLLEPGAQDVTALGSVDIPISETTTFHLTATNLAGTQVSRELTVRVVPSPQIQSFRTEGSIRTGQPATILAEFANGRAELRDGGQVLGASDQSPLRVPVTVQEGKTLTLVVTNEAGATVSQPLSFSPVRRP